MQNAKPEGERPRGKLGHNWEDNIKVDFKEIGVRVWTGFIRLRMCRDHYRALVNTVINLRVP
jgi:hypothetical protein